MPKYTETEKSFWEMMLHFANNKGQRIFCNICRRRIRSGSKEAHDHFFGKSHPNNNIYEIFATTPIPMTELVKDEKTGVLLPKEVKK